MKIILRVLGVCIISLCLIVTFFELYLRLYWEDHHYHEAWITRPSSVLQHELIPDSSGVSFFSEWRQTESVNHLGLRGKPVTVVKPRNTVRILLLGDSFVYGWGVPFEKAMGSILENQLRQEYPGKSIEVINAGVPSYAPILSYLQLKTTLISLKPDIVVYVFDESDVNDEVKYAKTTINDGNGHPVAVRSPYSTVPFIDRLVSRLDSYHFLLSLLSQRDSKYVFGDEENDHWIGLREDTVRMAPVGWRLVSEHIGDLKTYVQSHHAVFLMTAVPRAPQIAKEFVDPQDSKRYGFPNSEQCCWEMFAKLEQISATEHIDFVSPLPVFLEHTQEPLFYFEDGHLTARGQELMGQLLVRPLSVYLK